MSGSATETVRHRFYNRQERLGQKIQAGGSNISEDMGELHMGWHGWSKDWADVTGRPERQAESRR